MNREDFLLLKNNIIYFDNGATTLKPKCLAQAVSEYYNEYSANAHRGDYSLSLKVDAMYENTRKLVRDFIHAKKAKEIVFTSGSTDSLNKIIFGYYAYYLKEGDHILLTRSEHASNMLPWFELAEKKNLVIDYIELDEGYQVTMEHVEKAITSQTKVISIAHITNVIGDVRPIKEITQYAHQKGIDVVIDGAQSVPHIPVDVQELDVDFLVFSAHKIYGPTGVGVLYGKEKLLNNIHPIIFGGGMNTSFSSDGIRIYNELPYMLEAGTPNIAGVIGFGKVIEYLMGNIEQIHNHEMILKQYLLKKLKEMDNIKIYNEKSESGIVALNYDGIFAQDLAIYLNKYDICVRAGNHCAKALKEEINVKNTVRISLGLYNTKEEIDRLIEVLKNPHIKEEII